MPKIRRSSQFIFSTIIILSMSLSASRPQSAAAQGGDGLQRKVNAETGRVSFIGPESGRAVSASRALGSLARPADPAMALAKRFAPEFGLKNPERDLSVKKAGEPQNGRITIRYQQNHEGVPVIGGELIVNTNENGDLYSMNGEVSPNLSLQTQPTVDAAKAKESALQAAAKWYQRTPADFVATEPELWIFDESLLNSSTRPAELVWRMEVTSVDNSLPLRELVLINAQRGNISLHFNQVDTAWGALDFQTVPQQITSSDMNPVLQVGNWPIYFEIALDEARGWIYGSDSAGNKIDVISMTTLQLVKSFTLVNGASPAGIALSPNGSELAIAQFGAASILFLNPNNGQTIATLTPDVNPIFPNEPWDVIYGRAGRLYSSGNPYSAGIDYVHVINTTTHSEISKSSFIVRATPYLAISADKNTLYVNATFSPNQLYKLDVTEDTIPEPTGLSFDYTVDTYLVLKNGSKIFTNTGQVWSNPSDLSLSTQIGTFNASGYLVEIQSQNLVAVLEDPGMINFVNATDYSIASTISLPSVSAVGHGVVNTNESKLFVNSNDGIKVLNLDPSLPSQISIVSGSNQSTPPQSQFSQPLKVKVQNYLQQPLAGLTNTFTAPANGASGTFANTNTNISTAVSDANGIATSSAFFANSTNGSYKVKATVTGLATSTDFQLLNGILQIKTYTAGNSTSLPGTFLCNQIDPNCTPGDSHAKAVHKYAIGTYNFYAAQHGRDSMDNNGMTIISSVHYCSPYYCPYSNANWTGTQMIYGDAGGWPFADDVVAHEFTHGVTEYESNLFYYYQSGAINESFSDVWGEYYDQTNGLGNDVAGVKWQVGEDISGVGALRSMSNPPAFGDPDKMSSTNYYEGQGDSGGVHTNSAINNKAAFLMVDGGTFNGKTVSALGWVKTITIYYEAQTNILVSGSDYSDLYYALQQACSNMVGQKGITAGNCVEVKDAIDAVEMNGQPAPNFNTDAPLCDAGIAPTYTFTDDLETGTSNWIFTNGAHPRWQYDSPYGAYAQSGLHFLYADDYPDDIADASARLASFVVPPNGYMHFAHAYDFESYLPSPGPYYYDAGVLEYSINGGSNWLDAGSLINFNGYRGKVFTGAGNPLSGRSAFVGSSHGYISTRLNLASLAGKTVTFRWRMGLDEAYAALGWTVDNIKVYSCIHPDHNVDVQIGGTLMGRYNVPSQNNFANRYGVNGGPVKVSSTNGLPIFSSQRAIFGSSFNSIVGYPGDQLTTEYWFTSYDDLGMITYLVIGNPHPSQTAQVDVYIGGIKRNATPYSIAPGQRIFPRYGINAGPVRVVSTNGVNIFASERTKFGNSFNEVMGYPGNQLTTDYWFTSYDDVGMITYLVIGNPHATLTAQVDVYIGGNKMNASPYSIAPGQRIFPRYGINAGPVRVVSTNGVNIFTSERSKFGQSFNEVMGYPADQLTTDYWFTSYDDTSMITYLVIGNPHPTLTAQVDVYINGVKKNATPYSIAPGQRVFPRYAINQGPVHVVSTNGVDIFTSERAKYLSSFNEIMGLPDNQLTTDYWFTALDDVGMLTNLVIAAP